MLPVIPCLFAAGVLYAVYQVDQQSKTVLVPQQPVHEDDRPKKKGKYTQRDLAFKASFSDDDEDDDEDYEPSTADKKRKRTPATTQGGTKQTKPKRDPNPNLTKVDQWKKIREDLYVSNVKGDGACLFRAIVKALWFSVTPDKILLSDHEDKLAADLRKQIVGYIRKNPKEFDNGTLMIENTPMTVKDYCNAMAKPNTWGGQIEIAAYCNMSNKRVNVWMYEKYTMTHIVEGDSKTGDTIDVYWNKKNHYMAVLRV